MSGDPVIDVRGVSVTLGGRPVLEDVDFRVEKGDFYAVIGPNGGGKSTLLKVILGLIRPSAGTVRVLGGTPVERRHLLGYVPQYRTFDFSYPVTVGEMVLSGRLGHIRNFPRRYGQEDRAAADRAMATMGIGDLAAQEIGALSGGQQQRAIIARALVGDPEVLILDEPTVYVDAPTGEHFLDLLVGLREEMTVLLVTHDVGVLSSRVTKIACLNRRIFTHDTAEITGDMLKGAYGCPVDLIAHGLPHRVVGEHEGEERP
ncbi:metal ABC transporter ATP-binding protein [Methanofollis tationis]|uniref:Metal ABC transporter ATP-binding protein n=1 Tax=Methanofollis tationis TaxID=81417 RepID=A0A7K4HPZ5_9EURY|nr:metal ABC transporter ATP-binding protein [Methanofollis tationis]NVO66980.1 metal ABC transporter ATP-binding protein [Methanofollis tationis]